MSLPFTIQSLSVSPELLEPGRLSPKTRASDLSRMTEIHVWRSVKNCLFGQIHVCEDGVNPGLQ